MLMKKSRILRQPKKEVEIQRQKMLHVAHLWQQIDEALEELHHMRREEDQMQHQGCHDLWTFTKKRKKYVASCVTTHLHYHLPGESLGMCDRTGSPNYRAPKIYRSLGMYVYRRRTGGRGNEFCRVIFSLEFYSAKNIGPIKILNF
jgi:hypothetical protein